MEVVSADDDRYVTNPQSGISVNLVRVENDTYSIVETETFELPEFDIDFSDPQTRATFEIKSIYTMFGKVVVLRINNEPYYQMELRTEPEVQLLFDLTTRPRLHRIVSTMNLLILGRSIHDPFVTKYYHFVT